MDPKADSGMELSECLRLVLTHRIEVLETGYLYRGADHVNQAESLPDPRGRVPTSHRRKYVFHITSIGAEYFWGLVGDFYLSKSVLVAIRLNGGLRLTYASTFIRPSRRTPPRPCSSYGSTPTLRNALGLRRVTLRNNAGAEYLHVSGLPIRCRVRNDLVLERFDFVPEVNDDGERLSQDHLA